MKPILSGLRVMVWLSCLVLYFLPRVGRRDIFCWIPFLAFAIHMMAITALYAYVFPH